MNFYEKINAIQTALKAPKNLHNSFGNYKYRNAEGILEAVKPYLKEHDLIMKLDDEVICSGDKNYVKATATITDGENEIHTSAFARESISKKGMDDSQMTGTASSYARKYALNGLFLLDDTKDSDTDEHRRESDARAKREEKDRQKMLDQAADLLADNEISEEYVAHVNKCTRLDNLTSGQLKGVLNNPAMYKENYLKWLEANEKN